MARPGADPASQDRGSVAVLEEAIRIFEEIAALCADQRDALARRDLDRLVALGERAETLAARFRLLDWVRRSGAPLEGAGGADHEALSAARRRLAEAAAGAALAASTGADLLARTSAASATVRRVLEDAESAGYLANGETRPSDRPRRLERTA